MIALAVIAAAIVTIALLKVGISVLWDGTLTLRLIVGPFRFQISSGQKEKAASEKTDSAPTKSGKKKRKKSPWPRVLLSNWQELLELISRVLRMPVLDPLILKVTFGGDDPAESALNYGRSWAMIGAVMPILERHFRIGKREIGAELDQSASGISVYVKASLKASVYQCAALAVSAIILFLKLYQQTKQSDKAVQM